MRASSRFLRESSESTPFLNVFLRSLARPDI
eukprot:COSAG02_NODE_21331_length_793_cov_0.753602_1_plen_30_part_10